MYININKRSKAFLNIAQLLYKAIYSEVYGDLTLRVETKEGLGKFLRASVMMDRPFYEGRLWLAWAINYLVSKGIVERDEYVTQKMLSLYSRPDIIWDANPGFLPEYDSDLNADALLLSEWLCTEETLARYVVQEWSINHINSLERIFDKSNPLSDPDGFVSTYLLTTLKFLRRADALKVYPTKVPHLISEVEAQLTKLNTGYDRVLYAAMNNEDIKMDIDKIDGLTLNGLAFHSFILNLNLKIKVDSLPPFEEIASCDNLEQYLYAANTLLNVKCQRNNEKPHIYYPGKD